MIVAAEVTKYFDPLVEEVVRASLRRLPHFMQGFSCLFVMVLLALSASRVRAAERTWDGGGADVNWQSINNWDGNVTAPIANDFLLFAGTAGLVNTNDFGAGTQFNAITFSNNSGTFVLWGNAINLGGGITNSSASLQTINLDLALTGARNMDVVSGGTLSIGGVISGGFGLTKRGAGALTLNGANTFSGGVTLSSGGGTLNIGNTSALGTGTLTISGANTTFDNTTGSALTIANALTMSGGSPTFAGTSDLTINGSVTISGGNRIITVTGNTLTLNGVVGESGGSRALTKAGAGTLVLTNVNTYTGGTTVSAGTLGIGNDSALGTGGLSLNGGTVVIAAIGGARSINNAVSLDVSGGTIGGVNNLMFTGNFIQPGASRTLVVTNTSTTTFSGSTFTLAANNETNTLTMNVAGASGGILISSIIQDGTGTGADALTKSGAGVLTLSGANTYTGGTTINAGTLRISGGNDRLPTGTAVTLANAATAIFDLNDLNQTIGSLAGGGTTGGNVVLGSGTLTVGAANNTSYGGVISGSGALVRQGSGTLALTGTNTYSGSTTINAGAISLDSDATLGNGAGTLNLAGGSLNISAGRNASDHPVSNPINLTADSAITTTSGAGAVDLNLSSGSIGGTAGTTLTFRNDATSGSGVFQPRFSGSITFTPNIAIANGAFGTTVLQSFNTSGNDQTFNGIISGNGSYRRTASASGTGGNTIFNGANTYSGGTTLADGGIGFGVSSTGGPVTSGPIGTGPLTISSIGAFSNPTLFAFGGARVVGNSITNNGGLLTIGGTEDLTLSGTITLSPGTHTNQVNNIAATIFSGVISGSGGMNKTGNGTLTLSGANTYTGGTTLSQGTVKLGADNALPNTGTFTFAGGILDANNHTATLGPLSLTADSTLNLGSDGTRQDLTFASANTYVAGTLTVTGWGGPDGSTYDRFIITDDPGPSGILGHIQFDGYALGATWDSVTGEIVPVPEPINVALGVFGVMFAGLSFARRFCKRKAETLRAES